MFDVTNSLRLPSFLVGVNLERRVESASFLGEHRRAMAKVAGAGATPVDFVSADGVVPANEVELLPPEPVEGAPPPPAPEPPPAPVIDLSRLEAAIDRLRMFSDQLAAEARSDALELGLMIARKVVEGELAVNADRLFGVVKSAVARVGESRRIVVRMAPEDADLLNGVTAPGGTPAAAPAEAAADGSGPASAPATVPAQPPASARLSRGAAKVEIIADPTLTRGDCLVEGEHLSVDARLDVKFAEIRRALMESAWEEQR